MACKMSIREVKENSTDHLCAINIKVCCTGSDIEKKHCPFWHGAKQ